jgi:hypothetical protein
VEPRRRGWLESGWMGWVEPGRRGTWAEGARCSRDQDQRRLHGSRFKFSEGHLCTFAHFHLVETIIKCLIFLNGGSSGWNFTPTQGVLDLILPRLDLILPIASHMARVFCVQGNVRQRKNMLTVSPRPR